MTTVRRTSESKRMVIAIVEELQDALAAYLATTPRRHEDLSALMAEYSRTVAAHQVPQESVLCSLMSTCRFCTSGYDDPTSDERCPVCPAYVAAPNSPLWSVICPEPPDSVAALNFMVNYLHDVLTDDGARTLHTLRTGHVIHLGQVAATRIRAERVRRFAEFVRHCAGTGTNLQPSEDSHV